MLVRTIVPLLILTLPEIGFGLPDDIQRDVNVLFVAMRGRDVQLIENTLKRIIDMKRAHHIQNLTTVGSGFVFMFDESMEYAKPSEKLRIAEMAVNLAPDYPPLYFNLGQALLSEGISNIGDAIGAYYRGVKAWFRYPRGLVISISNLAFYLLPSLIITIILASFLLLLLHFEKVLHDVGDLFPTTPMGVFSLSEMVKTKQAGFIIGRGIVKSLSILVMILILILPFSLGLGLLLTALFWVILVSFYTNGKETFSGGLLLIFAILLYPLGGLTNLPTEVFQREGSIKWACIREYCKEEDKVRLMKIVPQKGDDTWTRYALAMHVIQKGEIKSNVLMEAYEHLNMAVHDDDMVIETSKGNVLLMASFENCNTVGEVDLEKVKQSAQMFQVGAKKDKREALKGLIIAQGILMQRDAMEETIKRLISVGDENDLSFISRVRAMTYSTTVCANKDYLLSEVTFPDIDNFGLAFEGVNISLVESGMPLSNLLLTRLTSESISILTIVCFCLFIVILITRKWFALAYECPRCGMISCAKCNARETGFDYCPSCLLEQVKPGILDPIDQVAISRRFRGRIARFRPIARWLSIPLPGIGQCLSHRPVIGIFLILLFSIAINLVLEPYPPIIDEVGFSGFTYSLPTLPPVLLGVVYVISLIDTLRSRKTE